MKNYKARLKDIAKKSGVSIASVSRYFNGIKIRDENVRRIAAAMQKLDLVQPLTVNCSAENSSVIGMVVPDIKHNFCSKIVSGVINEIRKTNKYILLESSESSVVKERDILRHFSAMKLAGLIYMPTASWSESVPEEIRLFDTIPLVVVGRRNVLKDRTHIYTDNITGGYLATKYLLNLGHRHIAFCIGTWEYPFGTTDPRLLIQDLSKTGGFASLDRFAGYIKALDESNIRYNPDLVTVGSWNYEGGCIAAGEILGKTHVFDSVITTSDTMASGMLDALKRHGYKIPKDISVMGWDDSELAVYTEPHLTSVRQSSEQMGCAAAHAISLLIGSRKHIEDVIFPVSIIPRDSTQRLN